MFVRKNSAKLAMAGLAAGAVAFGALAPAGAATSLNTTLNQGAASTAKPVDNAATDGTGTIVFAGSDTIQYVIADLADAWNRKSVADRTIDGKAYNILSYNALKDDGTAVTSIGNGWAGVDGTDAATSITTPNGSGPGLQLLGKTDANGGSVISYARSSSAPNVDKALADKGSKEATGFPFALDTVVLAVSAKNTTAPKTLTDQQVLDIYHGDAKDWSKVGGKAGTIDALQPKSGSGTAKFFAAQIGNLYGTLDQGDPTAINDGNQVVGIPDKYGTDGTPVAEHSGAPLVADANAVVPISLGRAKLWNATHDASSQIRVIGGFKKQRALWLFARNNATTAAALGQTKVNPGVYADGAVTKKLLANGSGFFCSPEAQAIIAADGFYALSSSACGVSKTTTGDIVPSTGVAPQSMYIANPLLADAPAAGGSTPPVTTPNAALKAAQAKLKADQAKLKAAKKALKKAKGHKKAVWKKKVVKLTKAIKKDKAAVAAAA